MNLYFPGLSACWVALLLASGPARGGLTNLWHFDTTPLTAGGRQGGYLEGIATVGNTVSPLIGASYFGNNGGCLQTSAEGPDLSKSWSFSTWFRTDSDTGATDALASWRPLSVGGFPVYTLRNQSGSLAFDVNATSYRWQTGSSLANGQWHHVLLVSPTGGAPYTLYVDGVRRANAANASATAGTDFDFNFRLGSGHRRGSTTSQDWDGWMDDAGLFDEAVTAELAALVHGLGRLGIGLEDFAAAKQLVSSPAGTVIAAGSAKWERVTAGLTGTIGSASGTIEAGTAAVVTTSGGSGIRIARPAAGRADIGATPATVKASVGFGQTLGVTATVSNRSATSPLQWEIAGVPGEMPSLEAMTRQFDLNRDRVLAEIPSRTATPPAIAGDQIQYGSYSNTGNRHYFKDAAGILEESLPLVEGAPRTETLLRNNVTTTVRYTVRQAEGFMALTADCLNASQFSVAGSFSSGGNIASRSSTTLSVHGIEWQVWLYRISNLPAPAVHHVFLTPANAGITSVSNGSTSENFSLRNLPASCRIHHLWFQRDFTPFSDTTMLAVARRFLQTTHAPAGWIRHELVGSGTTAAGATTSAPLTLDAEGLAAGTYSGRFAVVPAGTDVSTLAAEDFQTVALTVEAPQFTIAAPPAEIPLLPGFTQQGGKVVLQPANGFSFGAVTAVAGAPWLKAFPSENRPGELDLKIDTTGLAEGSHETTLAITAGTTRQVLTIRIRVWAPLYTQLLADPFRNRVYLLHDGSDHGVSSRVLVLNAATGAVVREIEAGRSYLMTQSLDGSRLYTMTRPANAIVPIDLHRMEAEAAVPLPAAIPDTGEIFGNLQPGPEGVVYFINRAYAGKLFAFDTRTRTVVQQIDAPESATAFFDKLRTSPDGRELHATLAVSDNYGGPFATLARYRIAADGRLTAIADTGRELLAPPSLSSSYHLQTTASGRLVSAADRVFEPGNYLATMRQFPANIRALAPDGEFVVCRDAVYNATGTRKLLDMPLPLNSTATVVTAEGHVFYAGLSTFGFVDPGADADFRLEPADGATVAPPQTLRWIPVDGTRDYRVHFSQDPAALAGPVPAAGTATARTAKHWISPPVPLQAGETWHWRVDAVSPSGLQRGPVRRFTVAAFGNDIPRIELDMVKGCTSQPVPLNLSFPAPPAVVTAGADRPWLKPTGGPGPGFEVDARLVTGDRVEGTITITADGNALQVPVAVNLHACDHVDLIADRNHPRAFALVRAKTIGLPSYADSVGPHFIVEIDPATGALRKCRPAGFGDGRLILSNDSAQLGIENTPNNGLARTGGVEILDSADFTRLGHAWAFQGFLSSPGAAQSALGAGDRLMTAASLINWRTGALLARTSRTARPLCAFSPDGSWLFGGDVNGVYRHDAKSPTLAQSAAFSRRYPGTELPALSRDGQRIAWGDAILDADLVELARTTQLIRGLNADGTLVATNDGLYHLPSLRRITPEPGAMVELAFCDAAGTLLYYGNASSGGAPLYQIFRYDTLLELDAGTIVPEIADGATHAANTIKLEWSDLPAASSFRVFFGTDASAVDAAQPGSELELGVTTVPSWSTPLPLQADQSYFWKVVAEGPAGISAGPVWSFRTPAFTLDVTEVKLHSPLGGPKASRTIGITAAPGANWSVATSTPWLSFAETAGTGSGSITVRADPADFTVESRTGSFTVTVGDETTVVPVTLECFLYQIREYVADPDLPVIHMLVNNRPSFTDPHERLYLIKMDTRSQRTVETVDLGMIHQSFNSTLRMLLHRLDDRVYVYHSPAARMVGCNRATYRIETTLDTLAAFGSTIPGTICPAGAGRIAVVTTSGPAIHDSATGAKLLNPPAGLSGISGAVASHSGDRIYCDFGFANPQRVQQFRIFADRVEAGPTVNPIGFTSGQPGISDDGETIFYRNGYYDRDLQLQGQGNRIVASNADGTLFLQTPTSGDSLWLNRGGVGPERPGLALFSVSKVAWSPVNQRLLVRKSTSAYDWVHPQVRDDLPLPAIPGGAWIATGPSPWTASGSSPAVIRTGTLLVPPSSEFVSQASLLFKTPVAGTLNFDWRNFTNGGEIFELRVNGSSVETRTATTAWSARSRSIPAGATVELRYHLPWTGTLGNAPAGELRNLSFVTSAAAQAMAVAPEADGDLDGSGDLLETALGSDPADAASRPVFGIGHSAGTREFYYERPVGAPFLYQVQLSDDLATWENLDAPATTRAAGADERVSVGLPPGRARCFARVLVTPLAP